MATITTIYLKGYFNTSIMDDTGFTKCIVIKDSTKVQHSNEENMCIPCCRSLDGKPRDAHAWKKSVKSSALENLKKHIKKIHPELIPAKPSIQQEVSKKQAK